MQLVPLNLTATHGQQTLRTSREGDRSSEWRVGEGLLRLSLLMLPRTAHLGTDGSFGNPKLMGPLPDAIISHNSAPPVLRTSRTAKTKLFYFPQIYNQAISGGLLLGHMTLRTGMGGGGCLSSAQQRRGPHCQTTQIHFLWNVQGSLHEPCRSGLFGFYF